MASTALVRLSKSVAPVIQPLGALARGLTQLQNRGYRPPDQRIQGVDDGNFVSALQPVQPFGPPDQKPLAIHLQLGQNLIFTPRPDARLDADQLQDLATYPLARIAITNVIDIVSSMPWKIQLKKQPGENRKEYEARSSKDDNLQRLTDFMNSPDGEQDFGTWIRPLLNDMLTIDAASIFLVRDDSNKVIGWEVFQGAYITCLVTDRGTKPKPPSPAYQQLWYGMPLVDLSTDQLIYAPRNIIYRVGNVASSLYGVSPTEALAEELEIGIDRLRYVKNFYKNGSLPNAMFVVPASALPDKVEEAQQLLNKDMAGNLEARRQFRYVQGFTEDGKDQVVQLKEPELADGYDELHIRRVAFGYGISVQRMIKALNRASAQSNQEAAEEEGIAPYLDWFERLATRILGQKMDMANYEFIFDRSRDADPAKQAEIDKARLDAGYVTVNEVRVANGLDERPEPEANQLGKWLANGWMAIGEDPQPAAAPAPETKGQPRAKGKPDAGGKGEEDEPEEQPGKVRKAHGSIPKIDPGRDSVRLRNATAQIHSRLQQFFSHVTAHMVLVSNPTKVRKDAGDDDDQKRVEQAVDAIMSKISWASLPDVIRPALEDAGLDGGQVGLDQVERMEETAPGEIVLSSQPVRVVTQAVINEVNQGAMDYARSRAAELVGMKYVDGELVTNPNAKWAITDSTRNMLRDIITEAFSKETPINEVVGRIKQAGVFSDERAKMIANTEVKLAQVGSNYAAWKKSGVVEMVKWLISADHPKIDDCDLNVEAGAIKFGDNFPSGVPYPPDHPNCLCSICAAKIGNLSRKW